MNHYLKPFICTILVACISTPTGIHLESALAHRGGRDENGCHQNRKTERYECHEGKFFGRSFSSKEEMLGTGSGNVPESETKEGVTEFNEISGSSFRGKVVKVFDGDTITVEDNQNKSIKVRLKGVDAPEKNQNYGKESRQFVADITLGQTVEIIQHGKDRYKRVIGEIVLDDGRIVNTELVRVGLAWWYYQYSDDRELGQLELDAKLAHIGLWKSKNPVPPWVYRKVKDLAR